jgi:hypothetical protein
MYFVYCDFVATIFWKIIGNSGYDFEHIPPKYRSLKEKLVGDEYFKWVEKRLNQIGQSDVPYVVNTVI